MNNSWIYSVTRKKLSTILAIIIGISIIVYFALDSMYGSSRMLNILFFSSIITPAILARILLFYVNYKKRQLGLRKRKDRMLDTAANTIISADDLLDL